MATHTTTERVRPRRRRHTDCDLDVRLNGAADAIRQILENQTANRGEAAAVICAVLADVLTHGVAPERRELLLAQAIVLIRRLWDIDDARHEGGHEDG